MRNADRLSAVLLIATGTCLLWLVIPAQIGPGPKNVLSPRALPQLLSIGIIVLSLALFAESFLKSGLEEETKPAFGRYVWRAGGLISVILLSLLALSFTHPLVSTGVLIAGTALVLGEKRLWVIALLFGALSAFGFWLIHIVLNSRI